LRWPREVEEEEEKEEGEEEEAHLRNGNCRIDS